MDFVLRANFIENTVYRKQSIVTNATKFYAAFFSYLLCQWQHEQWKGNGLGRFQTLSCPYDMRPQQDNSAPRLGLPTERP
jgi:hypothetical protein